MFWTPQKIIGILILLLGIAYGAALVGNAARDRRRFAKEAGSFPRLGLWEVLFYFCASIGISDYLLNTLLLRTKHLTEDRNLPGTLVTAGLVPGAVIAFSYLRVEDPVALKTLLPCIAGIVSGSALGARLVGGLEGARIRRIMGLALTGSLVALVVRILLSRGTTGTATGLSLPLLFVAVIFSFFWGAVNMIGVPMKPAGTAFFLLLGLSPLATLTMVLVMGAIGPMGGGLPFIRSGRYHQKLSCAAATCGSVGAILGCMFTISISALLLNILLLVVMLTAIFSLLKKD